MHTHISFVVPSPLWSDTSLNYGPAAEISGGVTFIGVTRISVGPVTASHGTFPNVGFRAPQHRFRTLRGANLPTVGTVERPFIPERPSLFADDPGAPSIRSKLGREQPAAFGDAMYDSGHFRRH